MDTSLLKSYLKYNYKAILIGVVVFAAVCLYTRNAYCIYFGILEILNFLKGYYHHKDRLAKIAKLKTRGLTEEDETNIIFTKDWDETRQNGLWRYCFRNGGLIKGVWIGLLTGLLFALIFQERFSAIIADPATMFQFIGYCYLTGAIIGAIIYRFLWIYNERRFTKLTDPLRHFTVPDDFVDKPI